MKQNITFEAQAVLRNLRVTPQKSRRVINLIRDKNVDHARNILKFAPQAASEPILKLLNSAVANALTKADRTGLKVTEDNLFISEVFADEGPTMKRFRPRARGSAGRIFKRTSHITIFVATDEEVIAVPKTKDSKKTTKKSDIKDDAKNTDTSVKDSSEKSSITEPPQNEGPAKNDPAKAAGKKHKPAGPKEVKAHGDNKDAKSTSGHRKENMRKKGA